ncbi:MAG: hypothetical protein AMXMBFR23_02020 [Chloroflexota bacterium]
MTAQVAPLSAGLLEAALRATAERHHRLCPRQVLGVRIGLAASAALGLALPQTDKRLLAVVETDGCFVDGVEAATGCSIGHRTLRLEDCGKVAATFVDVKARRAVRIVPRRDIRTRAAVYAPGEARHYHAQLRGYQVMPDDELLAVREVELTLDLDRLLGRAGVRVDCTVCGEEVLNGRELRSAQDEPVCPSCAFGAYYR